MKAERQYRAIQAVVQRAPYYCDLWYAGVGAQFTEGNSVGSVGCYLESQHSTIQEAKAAALASARAWRNTILTLGGCTFETLPAIEFRLVGCDLSDEYDF